MRAVAVILVASLAACGDNNANPDAGNITDAIVTDGGTTDFQPNTVGVIKLIEGGGFDTARAQMRDRADTPRAEHLAGEGDCHIYVHPEAASCNPACTDGFCVDTNTCEPWPQFASAGTIQISGLKVDLRFEPGQYWYDAQPQLTTDDLFDRGDAITATAPGGVTAGFTLQAMGVETLDADMPITLELRDGVDKTINWTAANDGRIQLALRIGWHGAPYEALLLCETEDDGSLTIPGSLIAQLPRPRNPLEQHSSWISRFNRHAIDAAKGPIELIVASQVTILQINHP